jgi:hypothetical protein
MSAQAIWFGDVEGPDDCYCLECAEAIDDPNHEGYMRGGQAAEGESCVSCDRVVVGNRFDFPRCANCGEKCGPGHCGIRRAGGPPQVFVCRVCFVTQFGLDDLKAIEALIPDTAG